MSTELMQYESAGVTLWRKPEQVLAEAKEAAQALISVINQKKNKVMFNGEQYIEREDWGTVAKFFGCTAKIIETHYVNYDGIKGFEAVAVCLDANQNEISRAESMCLADEKNWGEVPIYAWQDELDDKGKKIWIEGKNGKKGYFKGKKIQTGTEPKPLFQLRSMAQTRAEAKVLKSVFGYVVVLAGYQPTVAEEMTGNETGRNDADEDRQPVPMPTEKKAEQAKIEKFEASGIITARGSGKDNALWLTLKEQILAVPADKVGLHPFGVGDALTFTAIEKQGKERAFWVLQEVTAYTVAPVGDVIPPDGPAPKKEPDAMDEAIASGAFDVPIGTLEETRQGRIGERRRTRLYALMNANKAKTGMTDEILHKILRALPKPVEHVADLEVGYWEEFQKLMTGETDWRPFLED
jgi:hypothetical protein